MATMLIRTRSARGKIRIAFIVRVAFLFGIPLLYYVFTGVAKNGIVLQSAESESGIHVTNYEIGKVSLKRDLKHFKVLF